MLKRIALCLFVSFCQECLFGQNAFFNDEAVNWQELKQVVIPKDLNRHDNNDLLIIEDDTEFWFYENNHRLVRLLTFYVASEKGLQELKCMRLPESFDLAYDANFNKQGRAARIKIPLTTNYKLKKFSARRNHDGKWSQLTCNDRYEKTRWIKPTGEFGDEDIIVLQLQEVKVGDVVQVFYESAFDRNYDANLFYFYSNHPKLKVEYTFNYPIEEYFSDYSMLMPINIPDSCFKRKRVLSKNVLNVTDKITLQNLNSLNYPANSCESRKQPHVYMDILSLPPVRDAYPNGIERSYANDHYTARARHFEWIVVKDTINQFTRIYDRNFAIIRRFIATFPPVKNDSGSTVFFKALCDTFNNFRYITKNHLFYNQSNLYDLSNADHLLKRRLIGSSTKLCTDILNEKGVFYYRTNLQDKRYGAHNTSYRAHYAYEWELFAIPTKDSYLYFLPCLGGVKYYLNELPFYMEGTLASLYPVNFQAGDTSKNEKYFKFLKTHKGTFNENTRTENATLKINLDEQVIDYAGKQSLSGQFSTVLRHLYLNEYIDSTISGHYFKKCTDKPGGSESRIKLSSKITEFPFRYTFNCSEKIKLADKQHLNLLNWFSFTLSSKILPEIPTHEYFFDFDHSDVYNFMLDFGGPVTISNAEAFKKKINNAYFELDSEVIQNSEALYLLKVKLVVKQGSVPLADMQLLMDLVDELDALNNFTLAVEKKS